MKSEPLNRDFTGTMRVHLTTPTANGYRDVELTPHRIDRDAEALYGHHSCHYLAAAISCMTGGWRMVTLTGQPPGHNRKRHIHTGVVAPDGAVLDIFGRHNSVEEWDWNWQQRLPFPLRLHRGLSSEDVIELVKNPGETGSGKWWWTEGEDALIATHQHFARAVLRKHGYEHHLLPEAHSALDTQPKAPAHATPARSLEPTTAPTSGGTAMSGVEDIRYALSTAGQMATYVAGALRQASMDVEEIQNRLGQALNGTNDDQAQQVMGIFAQLQEQIGQAERAIAPATTALDNYGARL